MTEIIIKGTPLSIKDYYCTKAGDDFGPLQGEAYLKKPQPRLWLYVNVTNQCNAGCPFCVSAAKPTLCDTTDLEAFTEALSIVAPYIYGISFTGGEPMLYPDLLDDLVLRTSEIVSPDLEIDLATNGTDLMKLARLKCIERFTTIHISRHSIHHSVCEALMNWRCPTPDDLKAFISGLTDPGQVVLNCVLQKGGVESSEDVAAYLDFAIDIGVQNSSFITMFKCNSYCDEHYISPLKFPFVSDQGCKDWNTAHHNSHFDVWNRHSDYDYCHCLSGSYRNPFGKTRFYFRCPGTIPAPDYCRQLVYTADNKLQDGFGTNRQIIWSTKS